MNFSNMNGEQLRQYKSDNGAQIEAIFANIRAVLETAGYDLKAHEAFERRGVTICDFVGQVEAAALAFLPEELRAYLETTTAPMLDLAHSKSPLISTMTE